MTEYKIPEPVKRKSFTIHELSKVKGIGVAKAALDGTKMYSNYATEL